MRTRRLFSTLNRYAKAVSQADIVALDEDDVVAIVTRRLYEEQPLLRDKVLMTKSKNIPTNNKQHLTTIVTLYDVLDTLLPSSRRGWTKFKRVRPSDEVVEQYFDKSVNIWDELTAQFEPLQELRDSNPVDQIAAKYRDRGGGHLLFRPVGLIMLAKVIRRLLDSGLTLREAVRRVSRAPMYLTQEPWSGLLWDGEAMVTAPENKTIAEQLLFNALGGYLPKVNTSASDLKKDYARLVRRPAREIVLPNYV
jgi:DNA sulfur modification protein DndB